MRLLNLFELNAADIDTGGEVNRFNSNLQISIQHNEDELKGLNLDSLRLYYLDEDSRQWLPVASSRYDKETRVLTAEIDHFSHYGEQADPLVTGPGRVMAAQVDLHSGTTNFNYPLELPPGPGGFQPSIELTYNSGVADEMKNKRDVGSWVGIGWDLHLGRITKDLETEDYFLDLNSASHALISNNGTNDYYTNPDQHFKITRSGNNTWEMWDRDGNYYKFGGTTDSEQYLPTAEGGYYRWDLSSFEDTNGNTANITYARTIRGTSPDDWVRSAYPEYLTYGNVQIYFASSSSENGDDGPLRKDNPITHSGNVTAPKVMENRQLDSVEIKVSGSLIRKYDFTYNTRDCYSSTDYGGIYYAGKHVLTSITQVGSDNTTSLPPMTFSYQDLQTYRHTDEGDYTGNPGNAAVFTWPHLVSIGSGYGGIISFTYTQLPYNNPDDVWTRQVATGKTINSGIGNTQSSVYTYKGDPEYYGTGWDQSYRGFQEVEDTDAEGNYIRRYFYTTGNISGEEADWITGKEYKTERYNANNALLQEINYDWSYDKLIVGDNITQLWRIWLSTVAETTDDKTSRTRYVYDDYGNIVTEYLDGDISTDSDNATIHRVFYPNTTLNILNKPARERVYATTSGDVGGANLKSERFCYYDGNNTSLTTPPTKGNLTRLQLSENTSASISSYFTYDSYGNKLTSQSPNGDNTTWTYETTHHTYPTTMTYPVTGLSESYTYDAGTNNLLTLTDVNGQTTTYQYDTFKRLLKEIKPGDSSANPSTEYQYNDWGTINQQHIKILSKVADGDYLWRKDYFDGLGRVVQTQSRGELGYIIVSGTTVLSNRGLLEKSYVAQELASSEINGYEAPGTDWRYASYTYDGLGRVVTQANADNTTISHNYLTAWSDNITNELGYKKVYYYDAFQRLIKVEEFDASHQLYATTEYTYDVLGNLTQVEDNDNNTTTMTYNWLSLKTTMTDPDMGSWTYSYDDNGNLTSQTDAKSQTITFTYDVMNRLTGKSYPQGGTANVTYSYDSTTGGNYGKGQRTGMTDALGTTAYKFDSRGRLIEEKRTVDSVDYITQFTYDSADRVTNIIYPTGENVTQEYDRRGLPYSLSGNVTSDLVTSTLYNYLGQVTDINFGNNLQTTFGYWDIGGAYDNSGQSYGQLWEISTHEQPEDNWLDGWENRIEITIDSSKIDSDLTHFPVLIYLSDNCSQSSDDMTQVFDVLGDNSLKIAVTEDDGESQLYVEIEKWDSANEEAWLWASSANWTISSSANTTVYLYYDNDRIDNTYFVGTPGSAAAENVWDSNFVLVDHMQDDPDTSHTRDSTTNDNDSTKGGAGTPTEVTGKIGDGQDFDGSEYLGLPSEVYHLFSSSDDFEISVLVDVADASPGSASCILGFVGGNPGNQPLLAMYHHSLGDLRVYLRQTSDSTNNIATVADTSYLGAYHLLTYQHDASDTNKVILRIDGVEVTSNNDNSLTFAGTDFDEGNVGALGPTTSASDAYYTGIVDELRISSVMRSAAWLKATYYTSWDDLISSFQTTDCDLTVSSTSGGSVTTPGEGTYQDYLAGRVVNLVATSDNSSYQFVNWTGDVSTIDDISSDNTTITMSDNCSITANFQTTSANLTVSSTTGGDVTTPGEGTFSYTKGDVVYLIATPDSGYEFQKWTGDVDTTTNIHATILAITMTDNLSITANFQTTQALTQTLRPDSDQVTQLDKESGQPDNHSCVDESGSHDGDSTKVINAGSSVLYDLYGLTDPSVSSGTINYIILKYVIRKEGELNNSNAWPLIKTGGTEYYGSVVEPTDSWTQHTKTWSTNPKTASAWTWSDVNALQAGIKLQGDEDEEIGLEEAYCTQLYVEVNYDPPATYDLMVNSSPRGDVTTPGEGIFEDYSIGSVVNLVADPDSGYQFIEWTGDVSTVASVTSANTTVTMNGNYAIVANFEVQAQTQTIRPNSDVVTQLDKTAGQPDNHSCVDESGSHDGDTTMVTVGNTIAYDLYGLTDHSGGSGTIMSFQLKLILPFWEQLPQRVLAPRTVSRP